jgi:hypothetical protein
MRTGLKARLQRLSWAEWGILLILVLGIALRLVDASDAPLDFHPTRQLHNLLVARSIYYQLPPPPMQNGKNWRLACETRSGNMNLRSSRAWWRLPGT